MSSPSSPVLRQGRRKKSPRQKYTHSNLEPELEGAIQGTSSSEPASTQNFFSDQDEFEMALLNGDHRPKQSSRGYDEYQVKKPISRNDKQGMVLLCILCTSLYNTLCLSYRSLVVFL